VSGLLNVRRHLLRTALPIAILAAVIASLLSGDFSIDPVAAVLALIAIVVSFVLWRKSRIQPRLTHEITATPLVSIHAEGEGRITIELDGDPVEGVHLVQARLSNTGNGPIRAQDFERPLRISLGETAVPITVELGQAHPTGLNPNVHIAGPNLEIEPLLLNNGDSFTLKALVKDFDGPARLEAPRVAGLTRVVNAAQPRDTRREAAIRVATALTAGLTGAATAAIISRLIN
jgi:hypothetical protein